MSLKYMSIKSKIAGAAVAAALLSGAGFGIAAAVTPNDAPPASTTQQVDTPEPGDTPDTPGAVDAPEPGDTPD